MKAIIFTLIILIFPLIASADDLSSTKGKIKDTQEHLSQVSQKEGSLLDILENLNKKSSNLSDNIQNTRSKIDSVNIEIEKKINEKKAIELKLSTNREKQSGIIRNMYISRRSSGRLFSISGYSEMSKLTRFIVYLKAIANYRKSMILEYITLQDNLTIVISQTANLKQELTILANSQTQKLDSLTQLGTTHKTTIAKLQKQKDEYIKGIRLLQEQAKEIERRLVLEKAMIAGKFPSKIPWPVTKHEILHKFGMTKEDRFDTEFYNPGIDIKANAGADVFAVVDGIVEYTGWIRGYGNIIILRHSEGYHTLYGNLERISVRMGENILVGTKIGIVSPYGWLEGAKLHFEIRKGKQELNPMNFLS